MVSSAGIAHSAGELLFVLCRDARRDLGVGLYELGDLSTWGDFVLQDDRLSMLPTRPACAAFVAGRHLAFAQHSEPVVGLDW